VRALEPDTVVGVSAVLQVGAVSGAAQPAGEHRRRRRVAPGDVLSRSTAPFDARFAQPVERRLAVGILMREEFPLDHVLAVRLRNLRRALVPEQRAAAGALAMCIRQGDEFANCGVGGARGLGAGSGRITGQKGERHAEQAKSEQHAQARRTGHAIVRSPA
jgi:hypothetical protein